MYVSLHTSSVDIGGGMHAHVCVYLHRHACANVNVDGGGGRGGWASLHMRPRVLFCLCPSRVWFAEAQTQFAEALPPLRGPVPSCGRVGTKTNKTLHLSRNIYERER